MRFSAPSTPCLALLLLSVAGTAFAKKDEGPKPVPWSFAPLRRGPLPQVKDTVWPRTRIDYYILAKLEAAGLKPAPMAAAGVLQRRLAFDLTGLPPAAQPSSSWSRAIDETLRSPHYGERWARHWLDLARYADETPTWLDSTKYSYLYRDWVVQALNADMPYDRFVMRQLATDFLPDSKPQDRVALGFLGLSPTYFKELQLPPEIIKTTVADEWEEHVDAIGRTFLGLTLACARCHDHKSDPISAQDYYALAGVFASVKISELPTMTDDLWQPVAKARADVAALEKQIADLKKKKPADLPQQTKDCEAKIVALKTRTPHFNMPMANAVEEAALFVVNKEKEHGTKLDYKMGMSRDLELMKRGNPNDLGAPVPRRFLSMFPSKTGLPRKFTTGSGRLELAQAIVEDAAPLTARVIVNRLWKHHFGRGLVDTPSEFGNLGDAPTHPELLDDLAGRFMEHGWSLKWLHREILNSATWQQSSVATASEQRDPENKLYARMLRRRLDWESWRDAILTASGQIDLQIGGPAASISAPTNLRRSLYGASDRQDMDPMLRIHDVPDPSSHNPWRTETITPLQGLFALNSPFIQQQADVLGKWAMTHRVGEAKSDVGVASLRSPFGQPAAGYLRSASVPARNSGLGESAMQSRVEDVYARLFGRAPSVREAEVAKAFVTGHEQDPVVWSQYAQALLAGNEMLFVD
ncbi:MAG: Planctomycete cytochrome [Prosthecobacter sp.]|nr:Planctomycete cytochrome [Prosthecobacter sp.]